jgi:surface protein
MNTLFRSGREFNDDISEWDVSNVTDMDHMFSGNRHFNQSLNEWDVSKVIKMSQMFGEAKEFNQPLTAWNVSRVRNMSRMFKNAPTFNQPLNTWNVSKVTDMHEMFECASNFNQSLNSWNVDNVINMTRMFSKASKFSFFPHSWKVSSLTGQENIFQGTPLKGQQLASGDFTKSAMGMLDCCCYRFDIPVALRKIIISTYLYKPLDETNIENAVELWFNDLQAYRLLYGVSAPMSEDTLPYNIQMWVDHRDQCVVDYGHFSTWNITATLHALPKIWRQAASRRLPYKYRRVQVQEEEEEEEEENFEDDDHILGLLLAGEL